MQGDRRKSDMLKITNSDHEKTEPARRYLRIAGIGLAVVFLLSLSQESEGIGFPVVYAAAWAMWLAGWIYLRADKPVARGRLVWAGGLLGAGAPLLAVSLMLFKSGLHGHGFLEYNLHQFEQVFWAVPLSTAVGLGLAVGLAVWQRRVV